ncbi:hypothetical protein AB0950_40200 [Streptomyces sp. NPDC007189]|uniref:WD40 repeat domain-containing protein n=1 Tax=Streptomyces sp. NPDC007189 TaxID=3154315 RepID=UPI0034542BDC
MAAAGTGPHVLVYDTAAWRTIRRLPHPTGTTTLAFSHDSRLLATGSYDNTLRLWELTGPDIPVQQLTEPATIYALAF